MCNNPLADSIVIGTKVVPGPLAKLGLLLGEGGGYLGGGVTGSWPAKALQP